MVLIIGHEIKLITPLKPNIIYSQFMKTLTIINMILK